VVIEARARLGNRWAQIARMLPGRSDNDVKNRWYASLRKRVENTALNGTCSLQDNAADDKMQQPRKKKSRVEGKGRKQTKKIGARPAAASTGDDAAALAAQWLAQLGGGVAIEGTTGRAP